MDRALTTLLWEIPGGRSFSFFLFAAFLLTKQSGGVLQAMGLNEWVGTQQSRASGAGNLRGYDRFCGPWRSPEVLGGVRDIRGGGQGRV